MSWSSRVRRDFPILEQSIEGQPLVYLDSGASTLRPRPVVEAMMHYEYTHHSNVHRGVHTLSQRATECYEASRERVRSWLGAKYAHEIVFTHGTTEALNLVAQGWGLQHLQPGDEIVLSVMEHHANIIPWQRVAQQTGARLRYIPLDPVTQILDLSKLEQLLTSQTKVVAVTHVSNVLGTIRPLQLFVQRAREVGAISVVDGAQWVPHSRAEVQSINCDFYAVSAHKMYGPTGIGALYGKTEYLEQIEPLLVGGGMVEKVDWESASWDRLPGRLEAGTPPIAAAVGWAAAIDYLETLEASYAAEHTEQAMAEHQQRPRFPSPKVSYVAEHAKKVMAYAVEQLSSLAFLDVYASSSPHLGVISFNMHQVHSYDLGQILDMEGVAIRTGHHCAQPLMRSLKVEGTARASFGIYNTLKEVDTLIQALHTAKQMLLG